MTKSSSRATDAEAANNAMGPIEASMRSVLSGEALERALEVQHASRQEAVASLAMGVSTRSRSASIVFEGDGGVWESWVEDLNTGKIHRRLHATPPKLL